MKSYGLDMEGSFIIERVASIPIWEAAQVGRFIFDESNSTYWMGGYTGWISLGVAGGITSLIEYGFSQNQINASVIPFRDPDNVIEADYISEALFELSTGRGLLKPCISSDHIRPRNVNRSHIDFTITTGVIAENIPAISIESGTPVWTNLQLIVNKLEEAHPYILRKKITTSMWISVPVEELYRTSIVTLPISKFPIVQCYDQLRNQIVPVRIEFDNDTSTIFIFHHHRIVLDVVITG